MEPISIARLATILDARLVPGGNGDRAATGGEIDSRRVQPGDVFFALPGQSTHGVEFVDAARHNGAVCVVTDQAPGESLAARGPILLVNDATRALWTLAEFVRGTVTGRVIGITGSVGKTTTRQMLTLALQSQCETLQSPANFNNELGVPLSLLRVSATTESVVLELGAGRRGDIRTLCELARPHWGIVTRVAPAHLASFESLDGVRRAKQELIESLDTAGRAFLNADDPAVLSMASAARCEVTTFGCSRHAAVRAVNVEADAHGSRCTIDGTTFRWNGGPHLATSVAAVVAVARSAGVDDAQSARAIQFLQLDAGRGGVVCREPWMVIDETYNASPASVDAAIDWLIRLPCSGRRVLVLGDLLELGDASERLHAELGRSVARADIDLTLLTGSACVIVRDAAIRSGLTPNRVRHAANIEELQRDLQDALRPGDVVLLKASRGMALDHVVSWLVRRAANH